MSSPDAAPCVAVDGQDPPCDRLFVYGTLMPGQPNHHLLSNLGGQWEPGEIVGTLYAQGIGPTAGYPVVDLAGQGRPVNGYLFTSTELADHWERLDDFEGPGYVRVATRVRTAAGAMRSAFVYALDRSALRDGAVPEEELP